jgi:hypothetical protein
MFNLVSQAHNCGMVKDLLGILSTRLDSIKNASVCKAQASSQSNSHGSAADP